MNNKSFTTSNSLIILILFVFTVKFFREDIDDMYLQGFAADVGSNFDTGIYGFILGMSVTNFGPEVRFKGEGLNNPSYSE